MSKEKRIARKTERANRKKIRKEAFAKFFEAIKAYKEIDIDSSMQYKDKFKEIWKVFKPAIEFTIVLRITGEKLDTIGNEILTIGNRMADNYTENDRSEFNQKLSNIWGKIEIALEMAKFIGNDKNDEAIDKVIEVGEWMLGYDN